MDMKRYENSRGISLVFHTPFQVIEEVYRDTPALGTIPLFNKSSPFDCLALLYIVSAH